MKRIFGAKSKLLVSILMVLCIMTVGSTMAYLFATSDLLKNTFSSAELDTGIIDDKTEAGKTVSVTNKGKSPAWVRARLLVSGIDPENVVIAEAKPANTDAGKIYLVMPYLEEGKWETVTDYSALMNDDGWIHYTSPVASGGITAKLLEGVVFGEGVDPNTITITVTHESVLALDTSGTAPWKTAFEKPAGAPASTSTT